MSLWRHLTRGLGVLTSRQSADRELADELSFYADQSAAERVARGASEENARRAAILEMGNLTVAREEIRSYGWENVVAIFAADLRFAARRLRQNPGFTALCVATLALGIGANTAIFSVVHRLLLEPLPYPDGNRIVMLTVGKGDFPEFPKVAVLRVIRARARSIESLTAVSVVALAVQEDDGRDTVHAVITPNYMKMLGIAPALGRAFTPAEGSGEGAPVAMISYSRWRHEFGGRANAIGSTVEINYDRREDPERRQYTIIGVTPASMGLPMSPSSFNHNLHEAKPGVWLPLDLSKWNADEEPNSYARLRPGARMEQVTRELQHIIDSSPELGDKRPTIRLMSAQDMLDPSETRMIEVLFAAVGVLLLISCANVANLLMSRAWAGRREFAVRAALGAGRARLARQLLTESTLLALAGCLLGIGVARQALRLIIAHRPPSLANLDTVHVESTVLLWSAAISVLTGVLFGTLPALFAARGSVGEVLRSETRGGSGSIATRRVRSALIIFEMALSLILLVGAGLLVRSFTALQRTPLGFEPRGMVSFDVLFNRRTPRDLSVAFRNQIVERLRAVPGVTDAAVGTMPGAGFGAISPLSTDPDPSGIERSVPEFSTIFAGPNYFHVAGIRLIEGRYPDSLTVPAQAGPRTAPREVVVNRGLAARFWPNGGALGARLHAEFDPSDRENFIVVGIAEDVHMPGARQVARSAVLYQPPFLPFLPSFVVRTAVPATDLLPALRGAITSIQPTPYIQTTTVGETFLRDSLAPARFAMELLVAFAAVALILATVGLYGVISYGVTQRTREIGVRMALGAEPAAVARLVIGDGLRLAIAGVAIGAAGALAATRALSGMLFAVSALDPTTFAATALVIAAVALLASYLPARRALRMDPAEVLRPE